MKKTIIDVFLYLEPLWLGTAKKISIRRVLAIAFSIDLILNSSYVIHHWGDGSSVGEASSILLIEAGLIGALLALTTYSNSLTNKDKIQG